MREGFLFLDVFDAPDDGPLQPLGLLGVEVQEVTEGGRVPEPYPQLRVPLKDLNGLPLHFQTYCLK